MSVKKLRKLRFNFNEADANKFACSILAPRMAKYYSGCKNAADVSKIFKLCDEAAEISFDNYRRWHRIAVYKISDINKRIYEHFYSHEARKFLYINKTCPCCGQPLYFTIR